jgi:acyl-coenzyme A synthetase/AMP-(fatty) acid ligase
MRFPALRHIICVDRADADGMLDYQRLLADASDAFSPVATAAEDPALLIYTSGTTGPPKGALHAHRVLLGHLPAIEFYHEYFPKPDDRFWTPADWAWIGGLYDVLFPSWHYGVTVVAHRMRKFDAAYAFGDLARKDDDGYFWFVGRKDDVISSGGYRIGPAEIEDCLSGHSAVAVAAVVGSPEAVRGEVVKAFVQLRAGILPTPALARELGSTCARACRPMSTHAKSSLSRHCP